MHLIPDFTLYLLTTHGAEAPSLLHRIQESNVVNILLVALLAGILIKKFNLFSGIDSHQRNVAQSVELAEMKRAEASARLEEVRRRTANLNAEVDEILANAKESAEALSVQIIADAKAESAKIVENAKKRVDMEQRTAARELERRLLSDSLADARSELAQSLSAADRKRSVEAFLDELSEMKGGRS